jgi:hypothetical protein
MRDADRTIEKLLAALRDAEPSTGIELRILQAMEAREAEVPAPFWPRLRPVATSLAAALAIMVLLIIALHQHRGAPAVQQTTRKETVAQRAPIAPRRPAQRGSRRVSAVPETQAAGFPAPPLPLTEQERLLQRLAHRRNPEDTAILNPTVQAAQSAKAIEQFQQFFAINPAEMRSQIE